MTIRTNLPKLILLIIVIILPYYSCHGMEMTEEEETALERSKRELRPPYGLKCKCGGSVNGQAIEGCEDEMIGCAENMGCGTYHNESAKDDIYAHACCVHPENFMELECKNGPVVLGHEWWRKVVYGARGLWTTHTGWTCCCEEMCNGATIKCPSSTFLYISLVVMTTFLGSMAQN